MRTDATSVLVGGPWEHRFVSANGARFHVAEAGEGPLVVLLHGFPQFWWAWRHQLVALAEAGYRAAAVDMRGYGASDKPPQGYDTYTLASDVAAMIRALGELDAFVVGAGSGAWTAWAMPTMQRAVTRGVVSLGMPHPLVLRRAVFTKAGQCAASGYLIGLQRPFVPERQMGSRSGYVEHLLRAQAAPGSAFPSAEEVQRYTDAMAMPFVAHSAAEHYRWVGRSQLRLDGRRFVGRMKASIDVPVLHVHGSDDGAVLLSAASGSGKYVRGQFEQVAVPGAGHFLAEEAPDTVNRLLVDWLSRHR